MSLKLVKLQVYSDLHSFVIVVSPEKVIYLSTVSDNDRFDFDQGLAAAVVRYHSRLDHPKLPQYASFADERFHQGLVVTHKQEEDRKIPERTPAWLYVDYASQHPLIRDVIVFIPT